MSDTPLMPLAGINTATKDDAALQKGGDSPRLFVRDAVNVDISPEGRANVRPGARLVTSVTYRNLWQSPLHGDTFGTLDGELVRVDPSTWLAESLAQIGEGDTSYEVLNNQVCIAGPAGLYTFNGATAERLTIETPPAPFVMAGEGALTMGAYGVAVAWLRGALESALSPVTTVELPHNGALEVSLPLCLDLTVTGVRLYLTAPNGGELAAEQDYGVATPQVVISVTPKLGKVAQFRHLSPMPTGKYLKLWRGRLLTARANVLRFSEPLAYHLHNERHGFVQMPQRITFVQPVDGGIWVGQADHVAFLDGTTPDGLTLIRKASRAPVPGSAILVPAELMGTNSAPSGEGTAVWLAANGYAGGTAGGQLIEPHAGVLTGITGQAGTSVVLDRRLVTAVT